MKPQNSEISYLRVTFSEAYLFENALDKLSKVMSKVTDSQKGAYKPY